MFRHGCANGNFLVACVCDAGVTSKVHADMMHLVWPGQGWQHSWWGYQDVDTREPWSGVVCCAPMGRGRGLGKLGDRSRDHWGCCIG
eukprot:10392985-Lingulodinium_polyedra.AAC.1